MAGKMIEINEEQYKNEVLDSGLVVVDFFSTECPPCDALATKYEALSEQYGDDIKFVKIFRQGNRKISEELKISGSPTVIFYKDGEIVGDKLTGGIKKKDLVKNLDSLLSDEKVAEIKSKIKPIETHCDLAIIGGGPAGMTAGIYAAQAKVDTILVDINLTGGQVSTTHQVSNYPGFVDAQPGYMISHYMSEQARGAGAKYKVAVDLTSVDLEKKEIIIDENEKIIAKKIIIATGSSPRSLGIEGEAEYKGNGISYCATCDAKYFDGKHAIVIGGGNSAIEEALFITKFAKKVTIIHQFDELQANKTAQQKAFDNDKIEFLMSHEPREFIKNDDGTMTVKVQNLKNNSTKGIISDGIFVFVGMIPNIEVFGHDTFDLDDYGYIKTDEVQKTSVDGVFAAGDVASKPYRQITVAVAEGSVAAIQASKELSE